MQSFFPCKKDIVGREDVFCKLAKPNYHGGTERVMKIKCFLLLILVNIIFKYFEVLRKS